LTIERLVGEFDEMIEEYLSGPSSSSLPSMDLSSGVKTEL